MALVFSYKLGIRSPKLLAESYGGNRITVWQLEERVLNSAKPINFESLLFLAADTPEYALTTAFAFHFGVKKDDIGPALFWGR
jgi:hypothetical protein